MLSEYLKEHNECLATLSESALQAQWEQARDAMLLALRQGKKILIAGNGGSAADAQHFAAELVGRFLINRKGYAAVALTTDTSALTAIGNDYGFENIFSRQVEALATAGDCFVGITTSGDSLNILTALIKAKKMGVKTIVLAGKDGGSAKEFADISLIVPSPVTSHIQEAHQVLYHSWCKSLEQLLHARS